MRKQEIKFKLTEDQTKLLEEIRTAETAAQELFLEMRMVIVEDVIWWGRFLAYCHTGK